MNIQIHQEPDLIFETLGLLYVSCNMERNKQETIDELNKFGIDGEAFYTKHLKTIDKYVQAFLKHRNYKPEYAFFFEDGNDSFFSVTLTLLCENEHWLNAAELPAAEQIRAEVVDLLNSSPDAEDYDSRTKEAPPLDSLNDVFAFLDQLPFDDSVKWKLMVFLEEPHRWLPLLISAVNDNLDAASKALKEVDKPLRKLVGDFVKSVDRREDEQFLKLVNLFAKEASVYPALIMPLGQAMYRTKCYYGLYVDALPMTGQADADAREYLLVRLKALSDNSKLQILASLKSSPKYNLELAEQLGLSAATVSHHMNVLLACGLVGIDKRGGKVNYHLETEQLRKLVSDLEQFLL